LQIEKAAQTRIAAAAREHQQIGHGGGDE